VADHYLAFSTWGLDLVGPFKKANGEFTHIFIAMDKFTKWIKAKPAASITPVKTVEFVKEIMYRFGITNNGTQFTLREFKDFCADSGIKSTMPQCHTRKATIRQNAQMA
jgi:hypothetical protein